jgi:hypothetical protein
MAQAVFQHLVAGRGLDKHFDRIEVGDLVSYKPSLIFVQSAGTGAYHVGSEPDDRTVAKCKEKVVCIFCHPYKAQNLAGRPDILPSASCGAAPFRRL